MATAQTRIEPKYPTSTRKPPAHKLQSREAALNLAADILIHNVRYHQSDEAKDHVINIIPGASGRGKTRMGLETAVLSVELLQSRPRYAQLPEDKQQKLLNATRVDVHMTFNRNGMRAQRGLDQARPEVRIGVRLAATSIFDCSPSDLLQLGPSVWNAFTISRVVEDLSRHHLADLPDGFLLLFVHLDEIHEYLEAIPRVLPSVVGLEHLREMVDVLTPISLRLPRVVPVITLSGTGAYDAKYLRSQVSKVITVLPPLSIDGAIDMARDWYKDAVEKSRLDRVLASWSFQLAMHDSGLLPYYIHLFLESVPPDSVKINTSWSFELHNALMTTPSTRDYWKVPA